MKGRYDTTGNLEAQFEPGSNGRVLVNKLGIADAEDMDDVELDLLKRLHEDVFTPWDDRKTDYLAAIQAGMTNYGPMKGLVRRVLRETARNVDD